MVELRGSEIVLSAEDSIDFYNKLQNPNHDSLARRNRYFEAIDSAMTLTKTESGFCATFSDFDLSFLDQENTEITASFAYNCVVVNNYNIRYSAGKSQFTESYTFEKSISFRPAYETGRLTNAATIFNENVA